MMDLIDKFSDSINEIAKVLSINIVSVLLSISTGVSIDLFAQTDSFFHDTQNIWKAIAPIMAGIYTLYKITSDVYDRIKKYSDNKRKSAIK